MDRRYWDSDCFLGWLLEENDKVEGCGEVLAEAEDGRLLIVTSALTIAEVLAVRHRPKLSNDVRERVEGFFRQPFIAVRSVTRRTAEVARQLVWDRGIMPKDALHVATALEAKLPMLNTFDGGLIANDGKCGGDPMLCISKPFVTSPRLKLGKPHVGQTKEQRETGASG